MNERAQVYAETLAKLVQCETISSFENSNLAKFRAFHQLLRETFPRIFSVCEVEDFDGSLLMRWHGKDSTKEPVLLMNHHDVVEATGTWEHEPFSGDIADGKVWGRGTLDTKGGLWGMLQVAEELVADGFVPKCDVYFESACTEETTGAGADLISRTLQERGIRFYMVLSSVVITALQDYTMIIVALMFMIAGVVASLAAGIGGKGLGTTFINGLVSILPGVLMILMAGSIKYTLEEAHILDTILYGAVGLTATMPKALVILFIYLIALVMNFFISSGSAKAFLLMPLVVPMAQIFGIPAQLCVMAYAFGDGFSNVFYPTNPVLLISLGLADVDYGTWAKWSWKFQGLNLIPTSGMLLLGLAIGYC